MNGYSIFRINLIIPGIAYSFDDILPKLDSICSKRGCSKWDNGSIIYFYNLGTEDYDMSVHGQNDEVHEIVFRFHIENITPETVKNIVVFAKKNDFDLTIRQDITFDAEKLTEELLKLNHTNFIHIDNPIEFLKKQSN